MCDHICMHVDNEPPIQLYTYGHRSVAPVTINKTVCVCVCVCVQIYGLATCILPSSERLIMRLLAERFF